MGQLCPDNPPGWDCKSGSAPRKEGVRDEVEELAYFPYWTCC
jgi:hypothetical protein